MAVSLEAREPLLDHRLIEFAAKLPQQSRIRGTQGKWILKHTMERYLPQDILYRPKQGFVTPISDWFRGPLADEARAICTSKTLSRTGWFNTQFLQETLENHLSGASDNGRILWQLLILDKSLDALGIAA